MFQSLITYSLIPRFLVVQCVLKDLHDPIQILAASVVYKILPCIPLYFSAIIVLGLLVGKPELLAFISLRAVIGHVLALG